MTVGRRLLDNVDGVQTWFSRDPMTGEITIENVQDATPVVEANKHSQNHGEARHPFLGQRLATVPVVVLQQWLDADGLTQRDFDRWPREARLSYMKRRLNDRDWLFLRATSGSI